jgi:hypothetical protein
MADKTVVILPIGDAVFPHITEVDTKYEPHKYRTCIRLTPKDTAALQKQLKEWAKENGIKTSKWPWKELKSKDGGESEIVFNAISGADIRPLVFDAKNNKLPAGVKIGGGSKIRVKVVFGYSPKNGHVSLYMNAVQVVELVQGGTARSPFEETEGYTVSDEDAAGFEDHNDGSAEDDALKL